MEDSAQRAVCVRPLVDASRKASLARALDTSIGESKCRGQINTRKVSDQDGGGVALDHFCLLIFVNLTLTRITWKSETSIKESTHPTGWRVGMSVGAFS